MIRDASTEVHGVRACISGGGGANKTTGGRIAVAPRRALGASHVRLPTADLWESVSQVGPTDRRACSLDTVNIMADL